MSNRYDRFLDGDSSYSGTTPASSRSNTVSIRIHTMLNRVKIYDVEKYYESDGKLIMYGVNSTSQVRGKFVYPLENIEHYNICGDYDR